MIDYEQFEKQLNELDRMQAVGFIVTYLSEIAERDKTLKAITRALHNVFADKFE